MLEFVFFISLPKCPHTNPICPPPPPNTPLLCVALSLIFFLFLVTNVTLNWVFKYHAPYWIDERILAHCSQPCVYYTTLSFGWTNWPQTLPIMSKALEFRHAEIFFHNQLLFNLGCFSCVPIMLWCKDVVASPVQFVMWS